jgi:hypothetical membrane protein
MSIDRMSTVSSAHPPAVPHRPAVSASAGRRVRIGALLWVATLVHVVGQVVAAAAWPDGYSLTRNAISDLGVTTCGTFSEDGAQPRAVCSPWHGVFNAATVLSGVLLAAGAVLLRDVFPRRRTGAAGMVAMVVCGLLVAGVGLAPWDVAPDAHDALALGQTLAQWVALVLVAVAAVPAAGRPWRTIRVACVLTLLVSVAGLAVFVAGAAGVTVPGVPWGMAERLAFDTLTAWGALLGLLLLTGGRRPGTAERH